MEWIMIKVRVGQETFCKWGCGSLRFVSGRQEVARAFSPGRSPCPGCRPLLNSALNCFFLRREGKCDSILWALETHPGSRGLL